VTIRDHDRADHPRRDALVIAVLGIIVAGYGEPRVASLIAGGLAGITSAVILHRSTDR
jgi:4-hydroxy-3-methylbut-2-en-1-yl diphosphate synthase IspG/GcpE